MKVKLLGTRGSVPSTDPETSHFGGNTSCVQVTNNAGDLLILDAGTGIRRMSPEIYGGRGRIDILLTHLHFDHIQGLGFFKPIFDPELNIHIWGPSSTSLTLMQRLNRYLSPPLFPVHFREIPSKTHLHEISHSDFEIGDFEVSSNYICHPGPTIGYRINADGRTLTYMPDHEPIIGKNGWERGKNWISGIGLAEKADLLIHDSQYTEEEYEPRVGWGHSTMKNSVTFAEMAKVAKLILFHHDPDHGDTELKSMFERNSARANMEVELAVEGFEYNLD